MLIKNGNICMCNHDKNPDFSNPRFLEPPFNSVEHCNQFTRLFELIFASFGESKNLAFYCILRQANICSRSKIVYVYFLFFKISLCAGKETRFLFNRNIKHVVFALCWFFLSTAYMVI